MLLKLAFSWLFLNVRKRMTAECNVCVAFVTESFYVPSCPCFSSKRSLRSMRKKEGQAWTRIEMSKTNTCIPWLCRPSVHDSLSMIFSASLVWFPSALARLLSCPNMAFQYGQPKRCSFEQSTRKSAQHVDKNVIHQKRSPSNCSLARPKRTALTRLLELRKPHEAEEDFTFV